MADVIEIRDAVARDSEAVAQLIAELGYRATESEVAARLASPVAAGDRVFVALIQGVVVGLVAVNIFQPFHVRRPWGVIAALVVREGYRSQRVGNALLDAAERHCHASGCSNVQLICAAHRIDAHRFYERNGYSEMTKLFVKPREKLALSAYGQTAGGGRSDKPDNTLEPTRESEHLNPTTR
jgi:GNAT superfamily N-acetyltransferase